MVTKLRVVFLIIVLIPHIIMFSMTYGTVLAVNKHFNQIQAIALACSLFLVMSIPNLTIGWLITKPLRQMRELCSRVKQGYYRELLTLPNEPTDVSEEDEITLLMRDMNWMARHIGIREKELKQAIDDLSEYQKQIAEKNVYLLSVNKKLIEAQEQMRKQAIELEDTCKCMQVMAMTDPLTQIANRRCFFDSLDRYFSPPICKLLSVSLLILDIDKFKVVNDSFGHQAGDQVLREIATVIKNNIRSNDMAARIGGEEYAVLLYDANLDDAVLIASKIKKAIEKHAISLDKNKQIFVTVSIGVCTLMQKTCRFDVDRLYCFADQALYHSKNNGRNCISVFYTDINSIAKIA